MSFLKGLRGMMSGKPELREEWRVPEFEEDIDEIFKPGTGLHILYKHSYSCSVSIFAKNRVEQAFETGMPEEVYFYFVDVRTNRAVSSYIAQKSGVRHESPQLMVIKDGNVLWHGSHQQVGADPVFQFLTET